MIIANAGTPMMWLVLGHLVLGNLLDLPTRRLAHIAQGHAPHVVLPET